MTDASFSVDTHLFRELGELLVGRDSTALVELVKNSYDADATQVTVLGTALSDPDEGYIVVTDNGNGMTPAEFREGFLRVASRSKEGGDRRSRRFRRRFTGAKGIGRLAAHKLARRIDVLSLPYSSRDATPKRGVRAHIDWDEVEKVDSLEEVTESGLAVAAVIRKRATRHGTEIRLTRLRRAWTDRHRTLFLREIAGFTPPMILTAPQTDLVPAQLFPDGIAARDVARREGNQFDVSLEGDFEVGENYLRPAASSASWILEVDARESLVRVAITPTPTELRANPDARATSYTFEHEAPERGPFFVARILIREGSREGIGEIGPAWPEHLAGIRVYMEGFRVLPYGEPSDDWLTLDNLYKRRAGFLPRLRVADPRFGTPVDREAQSVLGNASYLGAVFLTETGAPGLEMLVNREGFVPTPEFEILVNLVGRTVDLSTRVRAASSTQRRTVRRTQRRVSAQKHSPLPTPERLAERLEDVARSVAEAQVSAQAGDMIRAVEQIALAAEVVADVSAITVDLASEQVMLRVLASLGMQMSAFVHEVNGLLAVAQQLESAIGPLVAKRAGARSVVSTMTQLRRGLERQATYLLDVVTPDARRRRSAQPLARQFDAAVALVGLAAERRGIEIENAIPPDLRTPPMFRAELTALISNLLTNAVKNAGASGRVRASAELDDERRLFLRLENTGVSVDPGEGERWFTAFESTTTDIDPALGQGLGLGLPITRSMLAEYNGTIAFVPPGAGFSTAVEVMLPRGRTA